MLEYNCRESEDDFGVSKTNKLVSPSLPVDDLISNSFEQIINKIHQIGVIYDIHFCRAGVGFKMYYGDGAENDFKDKLSVEQYYPDIRAAAIETYKMLIKKITNGNDKG